MRKQLSKLIVEHTWTSSQHSELTVEHTWTSSHNARHRKYLDVLLWDGYLGGENHHSIQCWLVWTLNTHRQPPHYSNRVVRISSDFESSSFIGSMFDLDSPSLSDINSMSLKANILWFFLLVLAPISQQVSLSNWVNAKYLGFSLTR